MEIIVILELQLDTKDCQLSPHISGYTESAVRFNRQRRWYFDSDVSVDPAIGKNIDDEQETARIDDLLDYDTEM